jgi:histidinol-phosphate aminotransferase
MILAGNGSDEILAMVMRAFVGPGDVLAYPHPTYSLYPSLAEMGEVKVVEVPWAANWSLPAQALIDTGARAVFFANPNAPSGTAVSAEDVQALAARFQGVLLVDEAYVDFAERDCLDLVRRCPTSSSAAPSARATRWPDCASATPWPRPPSSRRWPR